MKEVRVPSRWKSSKSILYGLRSSYALIGSRFLTNQRQSIVDPAVKIGSPLVHVCYPTLRPDTMRLFTLSIVAKDQESGSQFMSSRT